jgi:hypothetical protein
MATSGALSFNERFNVPKTEAIGTEERSRAKQDRDGSEATRGMGQTKSPNLMEDDSGEDLRVGEGGLIGEWFFFLVHGPTGLFFLLPALYLSLPNGTTVSP